MPKQTIIQRAIFVALTVVVSLTALAPNAPRACGQEARVETRLTRAELSKLEGKASGIPENRSSAFYRELLEELAVGRKRLDESPNYLIGAQVAYELDAAADLVRDRYDAAYVAERAPRFARLNELSRARDVEGLRAALDDELARSPQDERLATLAYEAYYSARIRLAGQAGDAQELRTIVDEIVEKTPENRLLAVVVFNLVELVELFDASLEPSFYQQTVEALERMSVPKLETLRSPELGSNRLFNPSFQFDRSLLNVPDGETRDFYFERARTLENIKSDFQSSPDHKKEEIADPFYKSINAAILRARRGLCLSVKDPSENDLTRYANEIDAQHAADAALEFLELFPNERKLMSEARLFHIMSREYARELRDAALRGSDAREQAIAKAEALARENLAIYDAVHSCYSNDNKTEPEFANALVDRVVESGARSNSAEFMAAADALRRVVGLSKDLTRKISFRGVTIDGKEFDGKEYEGKIVILCLACDAENLFRLTRSDVVKRLLDKYESQGVALLGCVNLREVNRYEGSRESERADEISALRAEPYVVLSENLAALANDLRDEDYPLLCSDFFVRSSERAFHLSREFPRMASELHFFNLSDCFVVGRDGKTVARFLSGVFSNGNSWTLEQCVDNLIAKDSEHEEDESFFDDLFDEPTIGAENDEN